MFNFCSLLEVELECSFLFTVAHNQASFERFHNILLRLLYRRCP